MAASKAKQNTEVQKKGLPAQAGKILSGIVVSDKMKDTMVVEVSRFVKHPKYGKFMTISKKFKAHDAGNIAKIGDKVEIVETRPISKDKHFTLSKIVTHKEIVSANE